MTLRCCKQNKTKPIKICLTKLKDNSRGHALHKLYIRCNTPLARYVFAEIIRPISPAYEMDSHFSFHLEQFFLWRHQDDHPGFWPHFSLVLMVPDSSGILVCLVWIHMFKWTKKLILPFKLRFQVYFWDNYAKMCKKFIKILNVSLSVSSS